MGTGERDLANNKVTQENGCKVEGGQLAKGQERFCFAMLVLKTMSHNESLLLSGLHSPRWRLPPDNLLCCPLHVLYLQLQFSKQRWMRANAA